MGFGFASPGSRKGAGTTVASAVPTDTPSAKQVIRNAAQSSAGRVRLTTQAGTAAEVGSLTLLTGSTDVLGAEDAALLTAAGITGLSGSVTADFADTTEAAFVDFDGTTTGAFATDVFTASAAHGLASGDPILFSAVTQVGGTGVDADTVYFVIATGLTSTAFKVSATLGGATIDIATADVTAATWHRLESAVFTTGDDHGLVAGDRIVFSAVTGAIVLPAADTAYFISATDLTATTFALTTTLGGDPDVDVDLAISAATWHKPASSWHDAVLEIAAS